MLLLCELNILVCSVAWATSGLRVHYAVERRMNVLSYHAHNSTMTICPSSCALFSIVSGAVSVGCPLVLAVLMSSRSWACSCRSATNVRSWPASLCVATASLCAATTTLCALTMSLCAITESAAAALGAYSSTASNTTSGANLSQPVPHKH